MQLIFLGLIRLLRWVHGKETNLQTIVASGVANEAEYLHLLQVQKSERRTLVS